MVKKILFPFLCLGILSAENISVDNVLEDTKTITDISPKLITYLDKTYLNLEDKGVRKVNRLVSSSNNSCILLENKIIYCEYGEADEIKLKLETVSDGSPRIVYALLMENEIPVKKEDGMGVEDEQESLLIENKELKVKIENLHILLEEQKLRVAEAKKLKENLERCEEKVLTYDEIAKKNAQRCETEKTEILALSKNKQYKSLKDYTNSTKQLIKIKEQQDAITDLLAIIDKYKNEKTKGRKEAEGKKGFFNF